MRYPAVDDRTGRVVRLLEEQYRRRPELDVDWTAFSHPELVTFLRILDAEEELHRQQVSKQAAAVKTGAQAQTQTQTRTSFNLSFVQHQ